MGKCLSCCATDTQTQEQPTKYLNSSCMVESVSEIPPGHGAPFQSSPDSCDSQASGPGVTDSINKSHMSFAEKIMYYNRSQGMRNGENKRSSYVTREVSDTKINSMFQLYKDPLEDAILSEGIERLCQDLQVRPEEFKVLLLAFKFDVEQMCKFSRQEFVDGCHKLRVDTIHGIQTKFPELLQEAKEPEVFKELYTFTFKFGLEVGQRILPTEMAIQLWRLVFSQRDVPILERWLQFLENHPHIRGIPRDTWNMFLNFVEAVGEDLSTYDDTEAWPCLFDDFVEYENDEANQNVHKSKEEVIAADQP